MAKKRATVKVEPPQDDPMIPKRYERDSEVIGRAIWSMRTRSDRSRAELARYLGVGESTVYTWEKGKADPSFRQVLRAMDFLAQPFDMLIGNLGPANRSSRID